MTDQNQTPDLPNAQKYNDGGRVADATDLNWVDRFCPRWSRPFLRFGVRLSP